MLRRRLVTIPTIAIAWATLVALAPLLLPLLVAAEAIGALGGGRFARSRLFAFGLVYTTSELVGLGALFVSWLRWRARPERLLASTYAIQASWASALLGALRRLYDVTFEVEGLEALAPGPVLVLVRHASLVDTLLPTALLARPTGLRLRFVLKRELEVLPCLDVAGHRIPNCFVERDGASTEREVERVRALARGLGPNDGVLIYPEGTRFTREKRARSLDRLAASAPERHARLAGLAHLLPVRPGGVLALLDEAPSADVVIVAHAGLEGLSELGDIVRGGLVGCRVRLRVERHPRATVPTTPELRLAWLDDRWREMDAWLARLEGRETP